MEITTTVRKAALMRLVTFTAPGNMDVRKNLRKLRLKIEEQGQEAFVESATELVPTGGFASENPMHPIELDLTDTELRRLDMAFEQATWDPRVIPDALEQIIWELADEIKAWQEDAEAQRAFDRLTPKQKAAALAERERDAEDMAALAAKLKGDDE